MSTKDRSPFSPGNPVPAELFVGREQQINEIGRYVRQSSTGRQENVFLCGERGIGKSSLASFLRHLEANENNFLGIHVFMGGVNTLEEMVRQIFERLLQRTRKENWFEKVSGLFGNHIENVGLFGVSVSFSPPKKDLSDLVRNFPEALRHLLDRLQSEKKGLFIALDDINGLAETEEFANWYKSFSDEVATHYPDFPVFIMLIGLPEKRDRLYSLQPSLMRVFRVIEIERLPDSKIREFLANAFKSENISVTPKAMDNMVQYSSGLPVFMHEIGDATFWTDTDGLIDVDDAFEGVFLAATNIGKKYIDRKVYNALQSKRYRSILNKLGLHLNSRQFSTKEVNELLTSKEKTVLHNLLRKLRSLGMVELDKDRGRGAYRFVSDIYFMYVRIQSLYAEVRKPKQS